MQCEFYFDVVCPYAYLASTQLQSMFIDHDIDIIYRPVLLGGLYQHHQSPNNPMAHLSPSKARHLALDMQRYADIYGVVLNRPAAHPRSTVTAMRAILASPDVPRAMAALYKAYWQDGATIENRDVVCQLLDTAGMDGTTILQDALSSTGKQALHDVTADAASQGVFGVPTFITDDQSLYFGQDRMHWVQHHINKEKP